ncbi:MAG: hypothetical protein H0V93_01900 [Euzebyales bacterium]|nr:hypothetical protein [Euzebyales bacterium]
MRLDELELVCREAATQLAQRPTRPLPASVVLPLPEATRVVALTDFPDDDPGRFDLLERFARDRMRAANAPCYGFLAEGLAGSQDGEPLEVVVVVFGARGHHPRVTAAPLTPEGLGSFTDAEELEPTAMPFLSPLQHAVDAAQPPDAFQ